MPDYKEKARESSASPDQRTPEQIEIDRLRTELDHFTKSGIIEIAFRNPSVAEYMAHWEGRALKAEAALREAHEAGRREERERCVEARKKLHAALADFDESDPFCSDAKAIIQMMAVISAARPFAAAILSEQGDV